MSNYIIPIVVAVFASTGFWQFVNARIESKKKTKSAETELLLGLAHDRIYGLCRGYIDRGFITTSEYDNLMYVWRPYHRCGGNGTGEKLIKGVDELPLKEG